MEYGNAGDTLGEGAWAATTLGGSIWWWGGRHVHADGGGQTLFVDLGEFPTCWAIFHSRARAIQGGGNAAALSGKDSLDLVVIKRKLKDNFII